MHDVGRGRAQAPGQIEPRQRRRWLEKGKRVSWCDERRDPHGQRREPAVGPLND